ncbi:MAG: lysophospholipid acyltransferase family protein [Bacteroidales bacterium]|nr:lysophospholipid acyltransferase family protein [Bacteroidales bacterium]
MARIFHSILTALLYGIAHLPFWFLYGISDFIFLILYYVVRYRRGVVKKNLTESFPTLTPREIKKIGRKFYRNFCDYMVETIKLLHVSDAEMKRRMVFENMDMVDDILSSGGSIAVYFSHCFNWEWAPSITLWSRLKPYPEFTGPGSAAFCQIYRPLKDQWFDGMMLKLRCRFHSISIAKAHTLRELLTLRRDKVPSITGFMSDQKPSHGDPTYVTDFLNHPTHMITGTETLARRLGMAAIYWDIEKVSRGHYKITNVMIAPDASKTEPMEITAKYAQLLQANIERQPAIWLWTHKRWKKVPWIQDPK